MAITTHAQLKAALAGWLDVSAADLTSVIDDLVMVGEKRIFREARTRDMETALSSAIASGVIALPASYVALKFAYVDGSPTQRLERRSAEWIYQKYPQRSSEGKPQFIARERTNFIFGPYPDSGYTVKGVYYARLAALSASVTNALFDANPDLYLFGCLAESEPLIGRDSRLPLWESKYQRILAEVNSEDQVEDHSGGALQMRVA